MARWWVARDAAGRLWCAPDRAKLVAAIDGASVLGREIDPWTYARTISGLPTARPKRGERRGDGPEPTED